LRELLAASAAVAARAPRQPQRQQREQWPPAHVVAVLAVERARVERREIYAAGACVGALFFGQLTTASGASGCSC
jgi:hypothetical protein